MKKILLTIATVGVLAVPAGVAFAQTDPTQPATPVPTCVDPIQDRVRDHSADHSADQSELGEPIRQQLRTHQQEQLLLNDGTCDADCAADHSHLNQEPRFADETGNPAGHRMGTMRNATDSYGNS